MARRLVALVRRSPPGSAVPPLAFFVPAHPSVAWFWSGDASGEFPAYVYAHTNRSHTLAHWCVAEGWSWWELSRYLVQHRGETRTAVDALLAAAEADPSLRPELCKAFRSRERCEPSAPNMKYDAIREGSDRG